MLIRDLTSCKQRAEKRDMHFLSTLLAACLIEAAIQLDGGILDQETRLDALLNLKLMIALGETGHNITPLRPRPKS